MKVGGEDPEAETFLRQWLDDVVAIEEADEDASVLKFPPLLSRRKSMNLKMTEKDYKNCNE